MTQFVNVYDTRSADYHRAFQVFLAHTDEKAKIRSWLSCLVDALHSRNVFIDAGAGNGKLTAYFQGRFQKTIAIEPSPSLRPELEKNCPDAEVVAETILNAWPTPGDLVLCSHVLYYIPEGDWLRYLERLASWLSPGGILAIVLQSHDCDCTKLLWHFSRQRPNLLPLADIFAAKNGDRYLAELERVPASIDTQDFAAAYTVAEFMLNLLPMPQPILREAVETYVRAHFATVGGGFHLSLDQEFLTIRARS